MSYWTRTDCGFLKHHQYFLKYDEGAILLLLAGDSDDDDGD